MSKKVITAEEADEMERRYNKQQSLKGFPINEAVYVLHERKIQEILERLEKLETR